MNQSLFFALFHMHTKGSSPLKQQTLLKANLLLPHWFSNNRNRKFSGTGNNQKKNEDGKNKGNLDQTSKTCFNCIIHRATALYAV